MSKSNINFLVLLLVAVLGCERNPNLGREVEKQSKGRSVTGEPRPDQLVMTLSDVTIRVSQDTVQLARDGGSEASSKVLGWGDPGMGPINVISDFSIEVRDDDVVDRFVVPEELWSDCYSPHLYYRSMDAWGEWVVVPAVIAMQTPSNKLLVSISGSDAGGAYRAFFEIDFEKLRCKRTIELGGRIADHKEGRLRPERQ